MIFWAGRFFVSPPPAGDRDISIGAAVAVTPSETPLMIYCPIFLIFSSHVSTSTILIVPHIWCSHHLPPTPSSHISFVVPIILPLCHIPAASASIYPILNLCLRWHTYLPCLSSSVYYYAVLFNLCLPRFYRPPPSPPSHIYAFGILILLHTWRVSDAAIPIVPRLLHFCITLLCPCSYWAT